MEAQSVFPYADAIDRVLDAFDTDNFKLTNKERSSEQPPTANARHGSNGPWMFQFADEELSGHVNIRWDGKYVEDKPIAHGTAALRGYSLGDLTEDAQNQITSVVEEHDVGYLTPRDQYIGCGFADFKVPQVYNTGKIRRTAEDAQEVAADVQEIVYKDVTNQLAQNKELQYLAEGSAGPAYGEDADLATTLERALDTVESTKGEY